MNEEIKNLMSQYYQVQKVAAEGKVLRAKLIPLLRSANLSGYKFNFKDRIIQYTEHEEYAGITQKHIKNVLAKHYPQINADLFIKQVYESREKKRMETLKIMKKNGEVEE